MKKSIVPIASIALLFTTGCSNGNSTSSRPTTTGSSEKAVNKDLENAKMDVGGLFLDNQYKEVDPDLSKTDISNVKDEVNELTSNNKQQKELLAHVRYAETRLAAAKRSQSIADSESNSKAEIKDSKENASQTKKDASSKAKASSEKAESESAASSSKAKTVAKKTSKANKLNSEYPLISSKFDLSRLTSYSSDELFGNQVRATGKIISLGADGMKQYHILLQIDGSDAELLIVESSKTTGKLKENDSLTVYGGTNGKSKITETQINTGISAQYLKDKVVLFMVDKVTNHDVQ